MVGGKTSVEESLVAVQGTAPSVRRSPSLLRNMVSTLKALSRVNTTVGCVYRFVVKGPLTVGVFDGDTCFSIGCDDSGFFL